MMLMNKDETHTGRRDEPSSRDPYANELDEQLENAVNPEEVQESQPETPPGDEGGDKVPSISDTRELFVRLARPADRRAKEFLPQWLRRQGRI